MKRGEIWTAAGGTDYAGKPRPVVILQSDFFDATPSVTICPLTTSGADASYLRIDVDPSNENGLRVPSRLMVDKISTFARSKLRQRVGKLSDAQLARLSEAVIVFLKLAGALLVAVGTAHAQEPITATLPPAIAPAWTKGIQAINQENYWNAVACGKQGGRRPLCVFYDAEVCRNPDFELAMFTPYKMVAYEVWRAVRAKQEPPTPSYSEAQRTRITVKLTPKRGAKNALTGMQIKRDGTVIKPVSRSLDAGVGSFIFDFPAFAPTGDITIDLIGKLRTQSCLVEQSVLAQFR
jgi:mRNA interferase MazF